MLTYLEILFMSHRFLPRSMRGRLFGSKKCARTRLPGAEALPGASSRRGSSARSLFRAAYLRGKKVLGPSSRQLAWRVSAAGLQRRIGYNYINFHARPRFFVSGPPWAKLRSAPCAPAERASWSATVLPEGTVPKSRPRIDLGKKNGGA